MLPESTLSYEHMHRTLSHDFLSEMWYKLSGEKLWKRFTYRHILIFFCNNCVIWTVVDVSYAGCANSMI